MIGTVCLSDGETIQSVRQMYFDIFMETPPCEFARADNVPETSLAKHT